MFGITYETWHSVCEMYFKLQNGSKKNCLQWFPFTKLTYSDEERMASEEFFNQYIKTGTFLLFPNTLYQSENFLQKSDGSFRNASLISPVLYLILQSIGKTIHKCYTSVRSSSISVYYAGNYAFDRPHYKQDYDDFFKELNASVDEYQYFIKTDITNFFANINIDILIAQIDRICNSPNVVFSQTQLHLFKSLLSYCGNGRFPLIENSMASSFLATVVYMDQIHELLSQYISQHIPQFLSFRMVRYVDDMYILFSSTESEYNIHKAYNEIRNQYSSLLKDYGLSLNTKKCYICETKEINQELNKSLYDEFFNGQRHNIEELFSGSLSRFLHGLSESLILDSIDIEQYNTLIDTHFSSNDVEFMPSEMFNYFIYENSNEVKTQSVIWQIERLVTHSISFISLDPKRLTAMIMKTESATAIKGFLNQLFHRHRSNKWNSYDTTIAITYLIQSHFQHIDLLRILSARHPKLYEYCHDNCIGNAFTHWFSDSNAEKLGSLLAQDSKAVYLFFMYLCEKKQENHMAAFAYYKNYFDRISAILEFEYAPEPRAKRPNYNKFYKDKILIGFYSGIANSATYIEKAHKLRNANPLCHSSSELLDQNNTKVELIQSINDLSSLIVMYIAQVKS